MSRRWRKFWITILPITIISIATMFTIILNLLDENTIESPKKTTYEIVSIGEYTKVTTNNYGAITDQDQVYSIWYKDNGNIKLIEDVKFTDYGRYRLKASDEDKIVFKSNDTVIVYITEDTMRGW